MMPRSSRAKGRSPKVEYRLRGPHDELAVMLLTLIVEGKSEPSATATAHQEQRDGKAAIRDTPGTKQARLGGLQ